MEREYTNRAKKKKKQKLNKNFWRNNSLNVQFVIVQNQSVIVKKEEKKPALSEIYNKWASPFLW